MAALAYLAKQKEWKFVYYTRINEALLDSPKGNLAFALSQGMQIKDISTWPYSKQDRNLLCESIKVDDTLIIPEGVRCKEAYYGIEQLAKEIVDWSKKNQKDIPIFLPSGTGTTALFLQKALKNLGSFLQVITFPCVGKKQYLQEQMECMEPDVSAIPKIIEPPKRYRFAHLYPELYQLWQEAKKSGIEFDLLYDPVAFATLQKSNDLPKELLYIHQGGRSGNITMEERYKKMFATIKEKKREL